MFMSFVVLVNVYGNITYETQQIVEAKEYVAKFKELNLDPNKYMILANEPDRIYILKGNTLNLKEVYDHMGMHAINACWVDEENFESIKRNKKAYYYYDCLENVYYDKYENPIKTRYDFNGFSINVLNENLNKLYMYHYINYRDDSTIFEIDYNYYETDSISFCIDRYDINDYTISVKGENVMEIDGAGKCYKAQDEYNISVTAKRNPIYFEPDISTQTDDNIYN